MIFYILTPSPVQIWPSTSRVTSEYGGASVSRIDKIICLFCKRVLQKRRYSAKDTYNLIDPTDCSHPIRALVTKKRAPEQICAYIHSYISIYVTCLCTYIQGCFATKSQPLEQIQGFFAFYVRFIRALFSGLRRILLKKKGALSTQNKENLRTHYKGSV